MKFLGAFLIILGMASAPVITKPPSAPKTLQEQRWDKAVVRTSRQADVRWIARQIERNESRYKVVSKKTGVPTWAIGAIHNMEASLSFKTHLHEGSSPLTGRTKLVPKGRPKDGNPPFTWEFSAEDALRYDGLDKVDWSNLTASLDALEGYNGWGYAKYHKSTPTPYLWAATSVYEKGKYVADGHFDPNAISKQIGVAAIFKELNVKW